MRWSDYSSTPEWRGSWATPHGNRRSEISRGHRSPPVSNRSTATSLWSALEAPPSPHPERSEGSTLCTLEPVLGEIPPSSIGGFYQLNSFFPRPPFDLVLAL